jgi:Sulfotransferase domain
MTIRVFGAGFGRTGTLSLKQALEELGIGACYHMTEVEKYPEHAALWSAAARGDAIDWHEVFAGYSAAVDWPATAFWREIIEAFPDARVVLTIRSAAEWYASFNDTILARLRGPPPPRTLAIRAVYDLSHDVVLTRTFAGQAGNRRHATEVFERHNRDVIASVDPARLLVYDLAAGWEPLCRFLSLPSPATPFPHLNTRSSFRRQYARTAEQLEQGGPDS